MAKDPTNWKEKRKYALSEERPDGWPKGVYAISLNGLSFLGIDESSNKLFWDGKELITRDEVRLGRTETILAVIITVVSVLAFLLEVAKTFQIFGIGAD